MGNVIALYLALRDEASLVKIMLTGRGGRGCERCHESSLLDCSWSRLRGRRDGRGRKLGSGEKVDSQGHSLEERKRRRQSLLGPLRIPNQHTGNDDFSVSSNPDRSARQSAGRYLLHRWPRRSGRTLHGRTQVAFLIVVSDGTAALRSRLVACADSR